MSRITGSLDNDDSQNELQNTLKQKRVCPFCGAVLESPASAACSNCSMEDTPASRQATKARIGPWFVLQNKNPSAPGMRFATLIALVKKGQVTPRSVVRGPTTQQLWRFAARVRGVDREFGICYSCGGAIEQSVSMCPHCQRAQEPPVNPNILMDVRKAAPAPGTAEAPAAATTAIQASAPAPVAKAPAASPVPVSAEFKAPEVKPAPAAPPARPTSPVRMGGEKILSPHDLAAAFRLDFKTGRAPGTPSNTTPLRQAADALQHVDPPAPPPEQAPAPRPRAGRFLGWAALWVFVVFGVAFFTMPGFKDQVIRWSNDARQSLGLNSKDQEIDPELRRQFENLQNDPADVDHAATPDLAPRQTEITDANAEPASATVTPAATAASTSQSATSQSPVEVTPAPAATSTAVIPPAPPVTEKLVSPTPEIKPANNETHRKVMELWLEALHAESRRAYAEEIDLLEEIRSEYPREIWPGGLDVRLANARRSLGKAN